MNNKPILVTGGAGYIGSHVVKLLGERGETVIVLDDLSTGNADAVLYGELVVGKTGDIDLVSKLIADKGIDTVMHFAAHTIVPESVSNPLKYYANNTCSTRNLLQACQDNNVRNFIFSSTAATYGVPDESIPACHEELATAPINAYGTSKLMSEVMLRDLGAGRRRRHSRADVRRKRVRDHARRHAASVAFDRRARHAERRRVAGGKSVILG